MRAFILVLILSGLFFFFGTAAVFAAAPETPGVPYNCPIDAANYRVAVSQTGYQYGLSQGYDWTEPIMKWNAVTEANSYVYHFWRHKGEDWENVTGSTVATESPYLETLFGELKPGQHYRFQVKACANSNGNDCSDYGNFCGFNIINPPTAPAGLEYPLSNAEGIKLNEDLSLTFKWQLPLELPYGSQTRAEVEGYHLSITKEDEEDSPAIFVSSDTSIDIPFSFFEPQAAYLWKVRTCADLNGNSELNDQECGPYSKEWSFEYKLLAPENFTLTSNVYPLTFTWKEVTGAKSYTLTPRLRTHDCEWCDVGCWITAIGNLIKKVEWFLDFIDYDPTCPWTLWEKGLNECLSVPVPVKEGIPSNQYIDTTCLFVENQENQGLGYTITISSCFDEKNRQCGPSLYYNEAGKKIQGANPLRFVTGDFPSLPAPLLKEPLFSVIGRKHSLRWYITEHPEDTEWEEKELDIGRCANFVRLRIDGPVTVDKKIPNTISLWFKHKMLNGLFNNADALDQVYKWRLQPCWQLLEGDTSCETGVWSETWYFKTVGAPPSLLEPEPGKTVRIPATLEWESIDGADSYKYQVAADADFTDIKEEGNTKSSSVKIDYPKIAPDTTYYWRVSACACSHCPEDEDCSVCPNGYKICGSPSPSTSFNTHPVSPPTNLRPATGKIPTSLEWDADPGSHFYQYMIEYTTTTYDYDNDGNPIKETLENCEEKTGTQIISPTITRSTNFWLGEACLGEYTWRVRSCLKKDCAEAKEEAPAITSSWSEATYIASEIDAPREKGIVPCGRRSNNPDTPYDEREPCQLKHLGFMLQNILDFVMWRLGLIVVALFSVLSAVVSYFSLGGPDTLARIKSIWKSVGMGYGIILLAWLLINLIMRLLGYQVIFFGQWWQLPF